MDPTHQWKSLKVFSKSCLSNTGVTNHFFLRAHCCCFQMMFDFKRQI